MEKHSKVFRRKTEEVIEILRQEYDGGASAEEGESFSKFSAAMGKLMTEFSTLHQLSKTFNGAFEFYFLAAEFTILPVVIGETERVVKRRAEKECFGYTHGQRQHFHR